MSNPEEFTSEQVKHLNKMDAHIARGMAVGAVAGIALASSIVWANENNNNDHSMKDAIVAESCYFSYPNPDASKQASVPGLAEGSVHNEYSAAVSEDAVKCMQEGWTGRAIHTSFTGDVTPGNFVWAYAQEHRYASETQDAGNYVLWGLAGGAAGMIVAYKLGIGDYEETKEKYRRQNAPTDPDTGPEPVSA